MREYMWQIGRDREREKFDFITYYEGILLKDNQASEETEIYQKTKKLADFVHNVGRRIDKNDPQFRTV